MLDQGIKASRAHPPSPEEQQAALLNLISGCGGVVGLWMRCDVCVYFGGGGRGAL